MKLQRLWTIVAIVAMLAASGCIFSPDDDDNDDPPAPPVRPDLTSEDAVVTSYQGAYGEMDKDWYQSLLDGEFVFVDTEGGITNYDNEIQTTNNMFDGSPGRDPQGNVVDRLTQYMD